MPETMILHGPNDGMMTWESAKESYNYLMTRKEVRVSLVDEMDHNLNSAEARRELFNFLTEVSR